MLFLIDLVGLLGVAITLLAYLLLNLHKLSARDISYSIMNAVGSSLVVYSLLYAWNLAAFVMEFIWLLISLYGIYQALSVRKHH